MWILGLKGLINVLSGCFYFAAVPAAFDLRSIIGCPGGIRTFRLYFRALFETFFLKVFLE